MILNVSIRWNCILCNYSKRVRKSGDFSLSNRKKLYGAHVIETKAVHVRRCAMYEYAVKATVKTEDEMR